MLVPLLIFHLRKQRLIPKIRITPSLGFNNTLGVTRFQMSQQLNMLLLISSRTISTKPNRLQRLFSVVLPNPLHPKLTSSAWSHLWPPKGTLTVMFQLTGSFSFLLQVWVFVQLWQHVWDPWWHWGAEAHGHGLRPGGGQVFRRRPKGGTKPGAQSPGAVCRRSVQSLPSLITLGLFKDTTATQQIRFLLDRWYHNGCMNWWFWLAVFYWSDVTGPAVIGRM